MATRLDPAVRREQIVVAAGLLFAERDPNDVTFEEIAEAAGVSRALVYNYFGDRGGLVAAVYLHHFDAVNRRLREAASAHDDPRSRTQALVRAYVDFAGQHPGPWRLLATRYVDHPLVREARQARMLDLAGGWDGSLEARHVANAVVGLLEGATLDWLEVGGLGAEPLADLLFALLWDGFGALGLVPAGS